MVPDCSCGTFKAWPEDLGEEYSRTIQAGHYRYAAESYVESFGDSSVEGDQVIMVRDFQGKIFRVTVNVELVPEITTESSEELEEVSA